MLRQHGAPFCQMTLRGNAAIACRPLMSEGAEGNEAVPCWPAQLTGLEQPFQLHLESGDEVHCPVGLPLGCRYCSDVVVKSWMFDLNDPLTGFVDHVLILMYG